MEIINATRMVAGFNMAQAPDGREMLVVVVKGTFRLPAPDEPVGSFSLHDEQLPLAMADTFTGEPGYSAPVYEADFAPRKPRCDILLLGSAHAPRGSPAARVEVGVRVGTWQKTMAVVGPRRWERGLSGLSVTPPEAFVCQPISYDVAFGGTDRRHEDPSQHSSFMPNPVGRGFHRHAGAAWTEGTQLPATEEVDNPVRGPGDAYRPMAFGPVGRGWEPRLQLAGTYDEAWLANTFPFLPSDFDPRYFQAAPTDQQLPVAAFEAGPVEVMLANLTPEGLTRFTIPHLVAPVVVFPRRGEREDFTATLDTVVIEPDAGRFSLAWRMVRPLKKNIFEISQVLVGRQGRAWWQRRDATTFPIPVVAA